MDVTSLEMLEQLRDELHESDIDLFSFEWRIRFVIFSAAADFSNSWASGESSRASTLRSAHFSRQDRHRPMHAARNLYAGRPRIAATSPTQGRRPINGNNGRRKSGI